MQVTVNPSTVQGTLQVPASKSMMQRICAAALLHRGKTMIHNGGGSDDDKAALQIIQQLGATVTGLSNNSFQIISNGQIAPAPHINCGESGLSARLFTAIAALSNQPITINAHGSLLQRPMGELLHVLSQLGVRILHPQFPISLQGPLQAKDVSIHAGLSSQFLSGLLFALSASAKQPMVLKVHGLNSKPYINLTLGVLQHFGKPIQNMNYESFIINPALFAAPQDVVCTIEADWSSASCFMVAAAIGGELTFNRLHTNSLQADVAILNALHDAGAHVLIQDDTIVVASHKLNAFQFDATQCPDLFPALCVLAAACNGRSYIKGLGRLFHKESNRAASIGSMLTALGVPFYTDADTICITGVAELQAATIDSCNDHRIVMAAAAAALRANGPVTILNTQAVNKSYPTFFNDLCALGVTCTINNN